MAEQRGDPELDNHAGVRHAGALFTVGFAASRALVAAALAERAEDAEVQMFDSDVVYDTVASGLVTATAEPGDGWDSALAGVCGGKVAELSTSVTLRDDRAKTVATMTADWRVSIAPPGGGS